MAVGLRLRLDGREQLRVSIDREIAYDLRDALFDDGSQSSSQACDLIVLTLLGERDDAREERISADVAADLVRGIDRVAELYDLPRGLVQLRHYLTPSAEHPRRAS